MKKLLSLLLVSFIGFVNANPIDDVCPQHVIWGAPKIKQEGNNQYLCRTAYAINYNYTTKVAYYSVELIKSANLVKNVSRKDDFREDPEVPAQYRSTLKDYQGSGYDRGHVAPAADMTFSAQAMSESFFLTNMMPQVPGNNRGIWKYTEELTRYYAQKYEQVYVITGTIFSAQSPAPIGNNVQVPSHIYKIIIDPTRVRAIAFLFPNVKLDPKNLEQYIVSIAEIEGYTDIDFSPAIPANLQGMEKQRASFGDW